MRRRLPFTKVVLFTAVAVAALPATFHGQGPSGTRIPEGRVVELPTDLFVLPDGLEVTVWATSPLLRNPTNIDIDKDGRIWVAEGVRYRSHFARQLEGDRIVVIEDTDGDGKADSSHTFVQEPALIAPLGVSVIDNKVVVAQPPDLIVYTDVDRNLKFDPATDIREVLLTGFQGVNHDHSLHSVTVGPDGKWVFNSGNMGAAFTDRSGRTFRIFSDYRPDPIGPFRFPHDPAVYAGRPSDDGHVYVGGFTVRMNPDGTNAEVIGHNYRNSYEQSVTSLGDVFQNDNDDPPASRVSWVMEYANFGFSSNDGQRSWRADQRPGQSIPIAEWRQEDPGITPAGDVYGGGSPTGNVFYENGALGPEWEGTFLAADAGRNEIFSYHPRRAGAGFALERSVFITTNVKQAYAGSDFVGGNNTATAEAYTLFRPSDIAVGPDGALYVSDWIDPRVGGHQDLDDSLSGAIYRIAPKGFVPKVPTFEPDTVGGLITALRSPAVNVRAIGFAGLLARGAEAVPAVAAMLEDPSPYMRGRALHLLYQLGPEGRERAGLPIAYADPEMRIAAYRAMRRAGLDIGGEAAALAHDADPGVRREVALSLRDTPAADSLEILVELARGYDGTDRYYLEALGTGATGKEEAFYERLRRDAGEPLSWSPAFARIAWRLHVPAAVADLAARAGAATLPLADRQLALDALAFIDDPAASTAVLALATPESPLRESATWWLLNRMSNTWADHDLGPALKVAGIYDPETLTLQAVMKPELPTNLATITVDDVLRLKGDAGRGRQVAGQCTMCHTIDGVGAAVGPTLDGWGRGKAANVIAAAIITPDGDIAQGFGGTELTTTDGLVIQGLLIKQGDPLMMRSMGGITQIIPADRVERRRNMGSTSLMIGGAALGLTAQDVADLVAYLQGS
jgi:putative membrane-bound dehydrogenase-like protein